MAKKHGKGGRGRHNDPPVSPGTWAKLEQELHGSDGGKGGKGQRSAPLPPLSRSEQPKRQQQPKRHPDNSRPAPPAQRQSPPPQRPAQESKPHYDDGRASSMLEAEQRRAESASPTSVRPQQVRAAQNPTQPRPSGAQAPPRADVDDL